MTETKAAVTQELNPAPVEIAVEFRNVTKAFGTQVVLDDVSCQLPKGRTTVIVGPSGTGKSVFLKLLVGLLKPDQGQILVDGIDITQLSQKDLFETRKKFGMLFQDGALFDSLNVGENIAFPLRRHTRKSNREIMEVVAQKLMQVGLPGIEHKLPSELSGGMRKRVGLARAMALDPEIILFDEPNSGLDPVMSDAIDKLIIKTRGFTKSTFLVISHDIPGTFQIADYIVMLYKSKVIASGRVEDIRDSENPILKRFFARDSDMPIDPKYATGELDLRPYYTANLQDEEDLKRKKPKTGYLNLHPRPSSRAEGSSGQLDRSHSGPLPEAEISHAGEVDKIGQAEIGHAGQAGLAEPEPGPDTPAETEEKA
ncbi:MAG TPA: ABC transporter ATP-binding protein [Candidatus Obscuribacterales bacterium]